MKLKTASIFSQLLKNLHFENVKLVIKLYLFIAGMQTCISISSTTFFLLLLCYLIHLLLFCASKAKHVELASTQCDGLIQHLDQHYFCNLCVFLMIPSKTRKHFLIFWLLQFLYIVPLADLHNTLLFHFNILLVYILSDSLNMQLGNSWYIAKFIYLFTFNED